MTPDGGHLEGARRLDRPHQGRRIAEPQPAAAGRRRAQHRRHGARLARPEALSARSDRRPTGATRRSTPMARSTATPSSQQRAAGARPGAQHQDDDPAAGPRRTRRARRWPTRSSAPSPYWGMEQIWDSQVNAHNPMMDQDGRVYWTAQNRSPNDIPAYCKKGSPLRSAQLYPLDVTHEGFFQNSRQVTVYDPKTKKFTTIDTCFGTHHLNFAEDANNTLWLSNNTPGRSWRSSAGSTPRCSGRPAMPAKSQGWTPLIVDTDRQRQARRGLQRARPAGRSGKGHAASRSACTRSPIRRPTARSGARTWPIPATSSACAGPNPPDTALGRNLQGPAARLWHPRHGCRPQRRRLAAARQRPYRQLRPAQMQGAAQRAGRREGREMPRGLHFLSASGTGLPGRSRAPRRTRITSGSTSTTFWGSAPMCRSRPATSRIRCTRWSAARSSSCACPTRWAFSPKGSKAASTTRTPAGRAAGYG